MMAFKILNSSWITLSGNEIRMQALQDHIQHVDYRQNHTLQQQYQVIEQFNSSHQELQRSSQAHNQCLQQELNDSN